VFCEPSASPRTLLQPSVVSSHTREDYLFHSFPRLDNLGNQYSTGGGEGGEGGEASIREHSVPSCRHYCCHHFGLVIKPAANVPARLSPLCYSATFAAQTKNRPVRTKSGERTRPANALLLLMRV